jgi:hypothetical protein
MSRKALKFDAPENSAAHQALIASARFEGLDTEAVRDLLWLINAHPALIAHDYVFRHIGQILKSDLCSDENLTWADDWKDNIPAWQAFCDWIDLNASALAKEHSALAELTKAGTDHRKNPLIRQGSTRHGIVTALRTVHESAIDGSQTEEQKRYLHLQGHCMLAFIEARFQESTRDQYESYDGAEEFPKNAPTPSDPVGLAIRTLADKNRIELLEKLPNEANTAIFSREIVRFFSKKTNKTLDSEERLIRARLRLCFERLDEICTTGHSSFAHRKGHDQSTGGGKIHHGFIDRDLAAGEILIQPGLPPCEDPDIAVQTLPTASFVALTDEESIRDLEADGIHPREHQEEIFQLYDPKAEASTLQKLRFQQCALDMAAQHFPWDYSQLTAGELTRLYRAIEHRIEYFQCGHGPKQRVEQQAVFAAMLLTSLFLGQPLKQVRTIKRIDVSTLDDLPALAHHRLVSETCAIFLPSTDADAEDQLVAFLVPVKAPLLRLSADQEPKQNQSRQPHLLLPAPEILATPLQMLCHQRKRKNDARVIGLDETTVSGLKSEFFEYLTARNPNHRITVEKIRRQLGEILVHQTNELTVKWLITSDDDGLTEPRMHYTRHNHDRLVAHFIQAAQRLAEKANQSWKNCNLFPMAPAIRKQVAERTVGCQFRVETSTLQALIASLQGELGVRQSELRSLDDIHRYHNVYTLYVWLFQSLTTTMRAIRSPDRMLNVKKDWNVQYSHLPAGLSDKDSDYEERARYVVIPKSLSVQLRHYQKHLAKYLSDCVRQTTPLEGFVIWGKHGKSDGIQPLTPQWLSEALETLGYRIPVNFHRAYLRSELIARSCPGEIIDAFMGHANRGELPFLRYSTFDYEKYRQQILKHLESILASLGFKVVASHLLHHRSRSWVADIHV